MKLTTKKLMELFDENDDGGGYVSPVVTDMPELGVFVDGCYHLDKIVEKINELADTPEEGR